MHEYLIGFIAGVIFVYLLRLISHIIHTFGTIEIDTSKDDKAIYRLNYTKDPFDIPKFKYVIFGVYKTNLKSIEESVPQVAKK